MNAVALELPPPDAFNERAAALDRELRGLGAQLRQAGAAVESGEVVPGFALVEALAACHRRFLGLRRDLLNEVRSRGLAAPDLPPPQGLAGLRPLLELLNGSELEAQEEVTAPGDPTRAFAAPEEVPPADTPPAPEAPPEVFPFVSESIPGPAALVPDGLGDSAAILTIPFAADPSFAPSVQDAEPDRPPESFQVAEFVSAPEVAPAALGGSETEDFRPSPGLSPEVSEACRVLDRVLSLQDRRGSDPSLLADCQAQAAALRQTIASGGDPETAAELSSGRHPLAALVALIGPDAGLDDAAWAERHAAVAAGLGKPLALAAARGRLTFPG